MTQTGCGGFGGRALRSGPRRGGAGTTTGVSGLPVGTGTAGEVDETPAYRGRGLGGRWQSTPADAHAWQGTPGADRTHICPVRLQVVQLWQTSAEKAAFQKITHRGWSARV